MDSSRPALEVADQNEQLNRAAHRCGEIEWIEANAFDLLKDYATAGRQYDTIVLDPPAFAKTKRTVPTALRGYKELNLRSLKMLGRAALWSRARVHSMSARRSPRPARLRRNRCRSPSANSGERGQSLDHPALLSVPETAYLKCVVCQVLQQ